MVSSVTNGYGASLYLSTPTASTPGAAGGARGQARNAATNAGPSSVNVTLSAEAKALLAAQADSRSAEAVTNAARATLDRLLAGAKASSALQDGKATIDVSSLDRRSLYAVASDQGGKFSIEEQVVASLQMQATREAALAPQASAMRVTGDYAGLYRAALTDLEAAGPEERSMGQWAKDKAALTEGLRQATQKPGVAPSGVAGDPVAAYLKQTGGVVANPRGRDIEKVATDVRAVLDRQYELAFADGMATDPDSGEIDFSNFDDRSLAAMALNKGGQFSSHEIAEAAFEIRARNRDSVSDAFAETGGASGGGAFGKAMITQYAAMSREERDAVGWSAELYDKMVAMQASADNLASLLGAEGAANGAASLLEYL